ncbi:MAG: NFACT RNA binding domain-containing protein [Nanoarchaeota archaeon]|mgnify:FL=1
MNTLEKEYQKYRWFYTLSGKLVLGGKSAAQNEELLKRLKKFSNDLYVLHTSSPGSPFSAILSDKTKVSETDLEEVAIFTGCFSRAWREMKKNVSVDIFSTSSLSKDSSMKIGTWGVKSKIRRKLIKLSLVLTFQKDKLRAVPEITLKKKTDGLLKIIPGNIDKIHLLTKLQVQLPKSLSQEEILSALPSGGVKLIKL